MRGGVLKSSVGLESDSIAAKGCRAEEKENYSVDWAN